MKKTPTLKPIIHKTQTIQSLSNIIISGIAIYLGLTIMLKHYFIYGCITLMLFYIFSLTIKKHSGVHHMLVAIIFSVTLIFIFQPIQTATFVAPDFEFNFYISQTMNFIWSLIIIVAYIAYFIFQLLLSMIVLGCNDELVAHYLTFLPKNIVTPLLFKLPFFDINPMGVLYTKKYEQTLSKQAIVITAVLLMLTGIVSCVNTALQLIPLSVFSSIGVYLGLDGLWQEYKKLRRRLKK